MTATAAQAGLRRRRLYRALTIAILLLLAGTLAMQRPIEEELKAAIPVRSADGEAVGDVLRARVTGTAVGTRFQKGEYSDVRTSDHGRFVVVTVEASSRTDAWKVNSLRSMLRIGTRTWDSDWSSELPTELAVEVPRRFSIVFEVPQAAVAQARRSGFTTTLTNTYLANTPGEQLEMTVTPRSKAARGLKSDAPDVIQLQEDELA